MKKFDDSELVFKDLIAIFISMIAIYLMYVQNWLALAFFSITVLICLLIYLNYEIMIHYKRKKNRLEIRHLFFVSTVSATVMLISFPFYFTKFQSIHFNLIFGAVMLISFITFIWSNVELIKEEFG